MHEDMHDGLLRVRTFSGDRGWRRGGVMTVAGHGVISCVLQTQFFSFLIFINI